MHKSLFLTSLLPLLASASPLVEKRAGGPVALPIPANCTTINPMPHANCGTANTNGYMVNSDFTTASLLYSAYFEQNLSPSAQAEQCFEQCNGYGNPGQCKSALLAYQVPTPKGYYGTPGGVLEIACLMYTDYLDPNQFVAAPEGQYLNATAVNIYCPS